VLGGGSQREAMRPPEPRRRLESAPERIVGRVRFGPFDEHARDLVDVTFVSSPTTTSNFELKYA
jgi:hypothetical protein